MILRAIQGRLGSSLSAFPVVALLGPRQVGKTTLALEHAKGMGNEPLYLDLERVSDRNKLADAELFLGQQRNRLVILDEVQRQPELFALLRSLVDERIREGEKAGHFLVLGSASQDLLRQSSESLAGRIAYLELKPFSLMELMEHGGATADDTCAQAWLRGGFPLSYLANSDQQSWDWRQQFIATYLERDIPQLGVRMPAEQARRLWTMLALEQGDPLNAAKLAASLGVDWKTVRRYMDVLTDLYMLRQLPPWSGNSRKRLVKSPKVYVRDSGLLHCLANIPDTDTLLGHPLCGYSWEGFVMEQILAFMPDTWSASYYRTSAQAEIDLVLEGPGTQVIALEIKRTLSPKISRGFRHGCEDVAATSRYYIMPRGEGYPLEPDTEAISLTGVLKVLEELWS